VCFSFPKGYLLENSSEPGVTMARMWQTTKLACSRHIACSLLYVQSRILLRLLRRNYEASWSFSLVGVSVCRSFVCFDAVAYITGVASAL